MRKLITTSVMLLFILAAAFSQVKQVAKSTATASENTPVLKTLMPEGHYCDYCKQNYPESHFPCIMKAIRGKVDAKTGVISFSEGQPIGGIVVKGGKNPGGNLSVVTNDQGVVEFDNETLTNYRFTLLTPGNQASNSVAGNPIGGIVVKGGKNPGGNLITVMTDNNGVVEIKNLPPGHYRFIVAGASEADKKNPLYKSTYNEGINPLYKN